MLKRSDFTIQKQPTSTLNSQLENNPSVFNHTSARKAASWVQMFLIDAKSLKLNLDKLAEIERCHHLRKLLSHLHLKLKL